MALWTIVILVGVGAAGLGILAHSRGPAAGPMACPTCAEDTNGLAVTNAAANTFTFNPIPLTNRSSQPVVLDSVALIKPSPGVHITRVAVSSKPPLYQLERGSLTPRLYPSTSLTDATGARIPPASGNPQRFSLVIFLAVPRSRGTYTIAGVTIDYHQGSTHYRASYREAARICLGSSTCSAAQV
jgi:hypothetical protein